MAGIAVFLLAFAVRLAYLLQIRDNPFFSHPFVDALLYDRLARQIAAGAQLGEAALNQAPLYPYFLGFLYRVLGPEYLGVRLVQVAIGALNCTLVWAIGRMAFNPRTGLLAGVIAALYGTLVFYDAELLRPVLIVFLSLSALLALLKAAERPSPLRWAGAGALLGLAAITWETILLFVPGALYWAHRTLRHRGITRGTLPAVASLCLAIAVVVLPVTMRNHQLSGDVVLVSAWGGLNFYLGNNPEADRTTQIQPGEAWEELVSLPEREAGIARPAQQSRWFYARSLDFIRERPLAWAGLLGKKLLLFWNAVEFDPNNDLGYYRARSPLLRGLYQPAWPIIIPFGVVAPLALLGMALSPAGNRRARLLLLFALTGMLALVLYHVRARYRLPTVPILIIFAAWALDRGAAALSAPGKRARLAGAIAGFCSLALIVNADFFSQRDAAPFPLHTTLGKVHLEEGRLDLARKEFQAAVAADPNDYDAWVNLGVLHEREGRGDAALEAFQRAIRAKPNYAMAHNDLGVWLFSRGQVDQAIGELQRAVALQPDYAAAHRNLGIAYSRIGRREEAAAEFALAEELEQ